VVILPLRAALCLEPGLDEAGIIGSHQHRNSETHADLQRRPVFAKQFSTGIIKGLYVRKA
jgi:hypothetical protein